MTAGERAARLAELAADVRAAEARGDAWVAGEVWRRYELVRDGGRDPDDLLAEGIAVSAMAVELVAGAEHPEAAGAEHPEIADSVDGPPA